MARTVERIEKDLAALEDTLGAIAQDMEDLYIGYLQDLGEAVSRQLVLATYQLCTQEYPEPFLALSLNQRQELQQAVRQLARNGSEHLQTLPHPQPDSPEDPPTLTEEAEDTPPPSEEEETNEPVLPSPIPLPAMMEAEEMMALLTLEASKLEATPPEVDQNNPLQRLVHWQQQLEQGIVDVLHDLSHGANRLLHHAQVLPFQLPEPVLEVAAKSNMMTEPTPGSPNLINLVIQAKSEEAQSADVMRLVAIRLRLAEVEFANPTLSNWRSRLRNLNGRLSQVGKEYRKNQKERAIAQAELAWRSSWYED